MKIIFFDIDGTLCPIGKGMSFSLIRRVKSLENKGAKIVLCSGKPLYYMNGFIRQMDLKDPMMIGENGGMVQFGIELPPQRIFNLVDDLKSLKRIKKLESDLVKKHGDKVWPEPGFTCGTVFFKDEKTKVKLRKDIARFKVKNPDLAMDVYEFVDCFDLMVPGIDKGLGVNFVLDYLGLKKEDAIAVGDGPNDQEMLDSVKVSISLNKEKHQGASHYFNQVEQAFDLIEAIV